MLLGKVGSVFYKIKTRRIGVACFRMLTDNDYLQQHLSKIGVTTFASCLLCGDDSINGWHLLICFKSKVYTGGASRFSLSYLYSTARQRIADWPKLGTG
ncbi:hypothetical protein CEXT_645291 [Caerostris extrusa]|uniref:Reverse transcriptase zinc-binding domain-containing protein n=1 Tax=Caerostris extrusa TaxID=172846 RepID=A0AAV4SKF3_CAEEX|nr:hypothetical protein CEXT_645291 [Caerostris extrusa]